MTIPFRERELPTVCPNCQQRHDMISDVGHGAPPRTGDLSICINCGAVNQITEEGALIACDESFRQHVEPRVEEAYHAVTGKHLQFLGAPR